MSADGFTSGPPAGAAADWTIDQGWDAYTPAEHAVWDTLYERQTALLRGRACDAFLKGLDALDVHRAGIPDFARINEELQRLTGWSVVAVPGLVPDDVFFDHLANRRFPAGRFIRKPEELDYLQEPDIFHDVFGHVPMLTDPVFADYMQAYGRGGQRAGPWVVLGERGRQRRPEQRPQRVQAARSGFIAQPLQFVLSQQAFAQDELAKFYDWIGCGIAFALFFSALIGWCRNFY